MTDNLLTALSRYSPRPGRNAKEDFLTEAFRWLLEKYSEFGKTLLEKIAQEAKIELDPSEEESIWETQYSLERKRPDMITKKGNWTIIFEHKDRAPLGPNQIGNYRTAFKKDSSDKEKCLVVLIARSKHETRKSSNSDENNKPDVSLVWRDIYDLASTLNTEKSESDIPYLKDFCDFLKDRGMGPIMPIAPTAIETYLKGCNLPNQLEGIMKPLTDAESWGLPLEKQQSEEQSDTLTDTENWKLLSSYKVENKLKTKEGVIGLQFNLDEKNGMDKWRPGVFAGVVLDGKDHSISHRLKNDGLKIQIILSFGKGLHDAYPKMDTYINFKKYLFEKSASKGWEFYDHLEEEKSNANKWHPLYLERPLTDLTDNCSEGGAQQERFRGFVNEAFELLEDEKAGLDSLIKECERKLSEE